SGGYTIIKDYMRERERRGQEVFVPLAHPAGHGQADFGEAVVIIGGWNKRRTFSCSICPTATPAMSGLIRLLWPRHGWTAISTHLPSWGPCRNRSFTTTTAAWWQKFFLTARASGQRCSAASCPIT